jgi:hypothetical protein
MILTGGSESTRKDPCPIATPQASVSDLEWNPSLRRDSPAISENDLETTCMRRQETARSVDSV